MESIVLQGKQGLSQQTEQYLAQIVCMNAGFQVMILDKPLILSDSTSSSVVWDNYIPYLFQVLCEVI